MHSVYLLARPFKLHEALKVQAPLGLGMDIAIGHNTDIMSATRHAVIMSRMRENDKVVVKSREDGKENSDPLEGGFVSSH